MGLANVLGHRYEEALRCYNQISIDTPVLRERRAFVYYRQGQYEKAIQMISDLDKEGNASPEIIERKAECEKAMNLPPERIRETITRAAKLYFRRSFDE